MGYIGVFYVLFNIWIYQLHFCFVTSDCVQRPLSLLNWLSYMLGLVFCPNMTNTFSYLLITYSPLLLCLENPGFLQPSNMHSLWINYLPAIFFCSVKYHSPGEQEFGKNYWVVFQETPEKGSVSSEFFSSHFFFALSHFFFSVRKVVTVPIVVGAIL